jgi:hypothetical protein
MQTHDEYLVYTYYKNTCFYFKNKKLHREEGPAIVSPKDKTKRLFEKLKDESLYTRVFEPVYPNEQNEVLLFDIHYLISCYYWDGVEYKSKEEMHAIKLHEELETNLSKIPKDKKMKI